MAALEARFEGEKEQIKMLCSHISDLYTGADYSFSWLLISEPFWIIFLLLVWFLLAQTDIWLYVIRDIILTTQLRYVLE